MYSTFYISEESCLSCNNKVLKTLGSLQGVFGAEIDRIKGKIEVNHTDEVNRAQIEEILKLEGFIEEDGEDTVL